MKAQKSCPKCSATVHARVSTCSCGHVFYAKKGEAKEEKPKATGAGPGRKQCPSCSQFIGVRNQNCPHCQYDFNKTPASQGVKSIPTLPAAKPVEKVRNTLTEATPANRVYPFEGAKDVDDISNGAVLVPAGAAPVKLTDFSENGIQKWAEETCKAYKGGRLTYGAVEYFARKFYGYPSDKDKEEKVKKALYGL